MYGTMLHIGNLGQFQGGKKFVEWQFSNPIAKEDYTIQVDFHNKNSSLYFVAHNKILNLFLQNSDIESLRKDVAEFFAIYTTNKNNIIWEDWLKITISNSEENNYKKSDVRLVGNATLSLNVVKIKKGINPKEPEKEFTISESGTIVSFPKPKDNIESINGYILDGANFTAYIKDSAENIEKLQVLIQGFQELGNKLKLFMSQKNIEDNLKKVNAQNNFLPITLK